MMRSCALMGRLRNQMQHNLPDLRGRADKAQRDHVKFKIHANLDDAGQVKETSYGMERLRQFYDSRCHSTAVLDHGL